MNKTLRCLAAILNQTRRNLRKTKGTQLMTLLTVSLSVLIFTFFFLIYTNMLKASEGLEEVRLTVYFEGELEPPLQRQIMEKIDDFQKVNKIVYISKKEAFRKLGNQLAEEQEVLEDLGPDFLPPSMEIYPRKNFTSLSDLQAFSDYLVTLPGAIKVQYGREWLQRFSSFIQLLKVITVLSASLLFLASTFMVSYTIRLTVITRREELEILRLLGATNFYIKTPLVMEGLIHGIMGSLTGLAALYMLFQWILNQFGGPGLMAMTRIGFFSNSFQIIIILASTLLCTGSSMIAIRKFLRI
jgi:cell division transport system permease protein